MLFCLRGIKPNAVWHEGTLKATFWSFNIGLSLMALLCLLPMGIMQLYAVLGHGYWFGRSAAFVHDPVVELLVWLRVPGDTIFSVGALLLAWFVLRLWIAPRETSHALVEDEALAPATGR
jgi:nitric oxide reductase subunit B